MSASSSSRVLLMGALAAASVGCGGAQSVGSRGGAAWHVIQFKGAALPAMRSNGQPWHTRAGDDNSLLGGLIGLAVGYPAVGVMLGSAMSTDATTEAPAPFLELKIAGDTYAMSPTGQSLAPRWQQPIAIPHGRYPARTMALIQLRDAMDQSVLGQRELTVAELLSPGARTLTDIGEVRSLDVEVQDLPPRGTATIELRVPADRSLEALTKGVDESWTPVPVWNGDRISISAKGKVCPSSDGSVCFGPEGAEPDQWRSYNYREFADERHASLVAILPGQTEGVGAAASFVVRQSGFMLLFVNDTDEGNNEGLLDVIVTIEPAHR